MWGGEKGRNMKKVGHLGIMLDTSGPKDKFINLLDLFKMLTIDSLLKLNQHKKDSLFFLLLSKLCQMQKVKNNQHLATAIGQSY